MEITELETILRVLNQKNWDWYPCARVLIVLIPQRKNARIFLRQWIQPLKRLAANFQCDSVLIRCRDHPKPFVLPLKER